MEKKISPYKDGAGNSGFHFNCPGCGSTHGVYTQGENVPVWTFNGHHEKPTFSPSVLVQGYLGNKNGESHYGRCHSFVREGKIQFLNDCTHELKGQTVEIPDWN